MTRQLSELTLRRQRLRVRIATQRLEIAHLADQFQTPLHLADHLIAGARFLRAHPSLLAGATGLLIWRRNTTGPLARTCWRLWQIYCVARGRRQP